MFLGRYCTIPSFGGFERDTTTKEFERDTTTKVVVDGGHFVFSLDTICMFESTFSR